MIEKKYIELINKDIDGEITPHEKIKLNEYLNSNSEAKTLYEELLFSENLLDKIPDNDPSLSLKNKILNSIDNSRYIKVKKNSSIKAFIQYTLLQPRYKIAISFALGVIAGLLMYTFLFSNIQEIKNRNVFGTIGLNDGTIVESIPLQLLNIKGNINVKRIEDDIRFDLDLSSPENYNLTILYDPDKILFDNISFNNQSKIRIDSEKDMVNLSGSGIHNYRLLFSVKNETPVNFHLQITRSGSRIFERKISINK